MTENMAFVCDEITPEMVALDEMLTIDDLNGIIPVGFATDAEEMVEITREITVDPRHYQSQNYRPDPNIPVEPDPDDDRNDEMSPSIGQDGAIAMDAAKPGSKANLNCNTTFANCQAKNPLLCPYHGAKLIEADIRAGLAQSIPNAVVSVKPSNSSSQSRGKNFSISIKVSASQKLAAEKALDDFLQQPGIKSQGMKDWDPRSNEWSDFYDIDLLQASQPPQGAMANRVALAASIPNALGVSSRKTTPSQQPVASASPASPSSPAPSTSSQQQNQQQSNLIGSAVQPSSKPASPAASSATGQVGGQTPSPGYQVQTDVSDDRKFITSLKGKAGLDEIADLEDLVDEKEQLMEQIDATRMAMSNGDAADAQMYQDIIDYALGGLKDVDEKVLDMREKLNNKYNTTSCQPVGATCAQIKANLQAQGATFIPKALDGLDDVMDNKIEACRREFVSYGLTEANNPQTWQKIQDLVSQSLANYLSKAALRTYMSGRSPNAYFFSDSTGGTPGKYYTNYGGDLMTDNYGIANPTLKEYRLCASATDADRTAWETGQSDWCSASNDSCAVTIKKDNTFCTYIDYNTGGCHHNYCNNTPISKPSILSLGRYASSYIGWIRKMLATGQPDMAYSREQEGKLTHQGHNEVHAFCGCDHSQKSEMILAHISSLEYSRKNTADSVVRKHAAELKKYGVKVYYYDEPNHKNIEIVF